MKHFIGTEELSYLDCISPTLNVFSWTEGLKHLNNFSFLELGLQTVVLRPQKL